MSWLRFAPVGFLMLAGFAALNPPTMSWAYVVAFMVFEFWLLRRMKAEGTGPPPPGEAPYHFSAEEADFVGRWRFYFAQPGLAREAGGVLSAIGLASLLLSFWLFYKQQLVQGALVAVNLLAVGTLTRRLAPLMVLRVAASKGDREALRMLELHDPLWEKIRAANSAAPDAGATGV